MQKKYGYSMEQIYAMFHRILFIIYLGYWSDFKLVYGWLNVTRHVKHKKFFSRGDFVTGYLHSIFSNKKKIIILYKK